MSSPGPDSQPPSGKRIARSVAVAIVVAAVLLVVAVLPAEYGIDLTGIGRALGLTELKHGAHAHVRGQGRARRATRACARSRCPPSTSPCRCRIPACISRKTGRSKRAP